MTRAVFARAYGGRRWHAFAPWYARGETSLCGEMGVALINDRPLHGEAAFLSKLGCKKCQRAYSRHTRTTTEGVQGMSGDEE